MRLSILGLTIPMALTALISACGHNQTATTVATMARPSPVDQVVNVNDTGLMANMHQLTYGGTRAGEGYFSPDGELMIFQSERDESNPFYQEYVTNLKTGKTWRVSKGWGKTTCGWVSPDKKSVTFASTHADPKSKDLQKAELDFRKSGQTRRYSWDYDEHFDIYRFSIDGKVLKNLTHTRGYNAEGSQSPDGKLIVFASNRNAYNHELSEEEQKRLKEDPSYFIDLFIMNADGSNVRQLTTEPGYDGGPFFSPDGQRIIWRHFTPDGRTAEVYTMNVDGSDKKQITHIGAMSWAPIYHPSGDYIVFTSNVFGFQNFELFIVDAEGHHKPVRVTNLEGFDGLPVFTPDGQHLTWNRKLSSTESQIVTADWSDSRARELLNLPPAKPTARLMTNYISTRNLQTDIRYLASAELKGRFTGSPEEAAAMNTIAGYFSEIGLQPVHGDQMLMPFTFVRDAKLGAENRFTIAGKAAEVDKDWRPLAFSSNGSVEAAPVVFAGYGIRAPADSGVGKEAYDSYAGIDVKDKWVMVLRYVPENVSAERRLYLQSYARLEHKAVLAKNLGARGIIFVTGPSANAKSSLIPFRRATGVNIGLPAISISDGAADELLKKQLASLQKSLDKEEKITPPDLSAQQVAATVDVQMVESQGHNVIGMIKVRGAKNTLIIGAHGDHLGDTDIDSSRKTSQDKDPIHYGADDNASGTAAVMEMARHFAQLDKTDSHKLKQNIIFAVWSGEELGNLGSSAFTRNMTAWNIHPSAYINLDMVGRWKTQNGNLEPLAIQGVASSNDWKPLIESLRYNFPVHLQDDPYLPTDSMALYLAGVPTVNFFTGVHPDYHTPRDTEDKINYNGLVQVTEATAQLAEAIASSDKPLAYHEAPKAPTELRRGFRIFLGTIPDYTDDTVKGVRLSGVVSGGPAEKAGLKKGDVIIEFIGKKIENIHDYVFTFELARPNEAAKIVVEREGKREELSIVPQAKE